MLSSGKDFSMAVLQTSRSIRIQSGGKRKLKYLTWLSPEFESGPSLVRVLA